MKQKKLILPETIEKTNLSLKEQPHVPTDYKFR